jgi:spermidine synthase
MATVAKTETRAAIGAGYALLALTVIWSLPTLYDALYEKLLYQDNYYPGRRFAHTVENRSGVTNMSEGGTVYGGGSYDGQMNISPLPSEDESRVIRAYTVPAFHPAPREILMIGIGSGSWLEVLSNLDEVDRITVVEINSGYVEMMHRTPLVAPAITHPKVEILIDDGRRYLNRTTRSFDVIIQNTIVYWRAHASTLLSQEYLELSGQHLKPGGVIYLNSTQSSAAQKTWPPSFPMRCGSRT